MPGVAELIVETSEGMRLRQPLAGAGSRAAAMAFDGFAFVLAYAVVVLGGVLATELAGVGTIVPYFLIGAGPLVLVAVRVLQQAAWRGQTMGKRLVGLRVLSGDGYPASVFQLVLRDLLLIVDLMVLPAYVDLVLVQLGGRRQRLGDLAANTVVVRELPARRERPPFAGQSYAGLEPKTLPLTPGSAARFDAEDLDLLRALWERRDVRLDERRRLFVHAARHYADRLGVAEFDDARTLLKELYLYLRDARSGAAAGGAPAEGPA